jgi:hypothetical protein
MIIWLLLTATFVVVGWDLVLRPWIRWVQRRRKADSEAYRARTDKIIDDSLGTWVLDSLRARDRRRGYGHWLGK